MGNALGGWQQAVEGGFPPIERGLLVLVAIAYPFHFPMPTPAGSVNTSYGDPLVGFVCILFVIGVIGVNHRALLRYATPVALFIVAAFVSLVANIYLSPLPETYDFMTGIVEIVKFGGGIAWMVAAYALLARAPADRLRDFAVISLVLVLGFAVFTLFMKVSGSSARPKGPFVSVNIFANYLLFNIALGAYLVAYYSRPVSAAIAADTRRRVRRLLLWIAIPILISALVITGSRGALLGLAAGTAALAALTIRHISLSRVQARLHGAVYGIYALLGLGFLSLFAPRVLNRFLESILEGGGDNSSSRLENWRIAWGAFRENPLLGIGYGQYPEYMAVVMPRRFGIFAHNTYMTTLAQMGVVGLLILLAFVALLVRDGWTLTQRRRVVVAAPIVAVIIGTFTQGLVADVDNFRSLWLAVGALAAFYGTGPIRDSVSVSRETKRSKRKPTAPTQ